MITTFITGIIAAVLSFFGIPPGPYVAGVWIGVKIVVIGVTVLIGYRMQKKKRLKAAAEARAAAAKVTAEALAADAAAAAAEQFAANPEGGVVAPAPARANAAKVTDT